MSRARLASKLHWPPLKVFLRLSQPPFGAACERGLVAVATVYSRLLYIAAFYWPGP
jgi:hypothetical protein